MNKIDIFSQITIKSGVAALIKEIVTERGFYRVEQEQKVLLLSELAQGLDVIYQMPSTTVVVSDLEGHKTHYDVTENKIVVVKESMISFLGAYREAMVAKGKVTQLTEPMYVHAWACKAFKLACPNSFKKSVMEGKVSGFVWNEEEDKAFMLDFSDEILCDFDEEKDADEESTEDSQE